MVYVWKYPLAVSAQVAGEFLAGLEKEHGTLTPEMVLNESRDKNAVLHPCFEWDDEKAAENYRLHQAGQIIRNVTVKIEREKKPPQFIRAYVNIKDNENHEKGKYVSLNIAMKNKDYKTQVLQNAMYELKTFKNKYSSYVEFDKVFLAIDELTSKLSKGSE